MNITDLHIGMKVRHPHYGVGIVKSLTEHTADIYFDEGKRIVEPATCGLKAEDAQADIEGLKVPLKQFVREVLSSAISELGLEKDDRYLTELAARWHKGTIVIKPSDPSLQAKEVPLEAFFHKIVMMRNNLRVLEQKINGSETLNSGEKFDWQQYITKCYGSMTTFNVFFKDKESHFSGSGN